MIKTKIPKEYEKKAEEDKKYYNQLFKRIKKEYKTKKYPEIITVKKNENKTGTAIAYPIQGILKYHGMPDWQYRTAYIPSISFCNDCAYTITYVSFSKKLKEDKIIINNTTATEQEKRRILQIIDFLRRITNTDLRVSIFSNNFFSNGEEIKSEIPKGLGTSASAGAALALAATEALLGKKYSSNKQFVSSIARLLAGSASRSVTGGISLWLSYPGISHEECISLRIDNNQFQDIELITIPIASIKNIKTEQAHIEAVSSPFFRKWLENRKQTLIIALNAIRNNNFFTLAKLAEEDTLTLHLVTMTAKKPLILYEEKTLQIMELCYKLRNNKIPVYFSIDTGPTVVLMTSKEYTNIIIQELKNINITNAIKGRIAEGAKIIKLAEEN